MNTKTRRELLVFLAGILIAALMGAAVSLFAFSGGAVFADANDTEVSAAVVTYYDEDNAEKTTNYTTLSAAITEAPDGSTVTLLSDCESSDSFAISKNLTIDLGGYNVTVTGQQQAFDIQSGAVVSIMNTAENAESKITSNRDSGIALGFLVRSGDLTLKNVTVEVNGTASVMGAYALQGTADAPNNITLDTVVVKATTTSTAAQYAAYGVYIASVKSGDTYICYATVLVNDSELTTKGCSAYGVYFSGNDLVTIDENQYVLLVSGSTFNLYSVAGASFLDFNNSYGIYFSSSKSTANEDNRTANYPQKVSVTDTKIIDQGGYKATEVSSSGATSYNPKSAIYVRGATLTLENITVSAADGTEGFSCAVDVQNANVEAKNLDLTAKTVGLSITGSNQGTLEGSNATNTSKFVLSGNNTITATTSQTGTTYGSTSATTSAIYTYSDVFLTLQGTTELSSAGNGININTYYGYIDLTMEGEVNISSTNPDATKYGGIVDNGDNAANKITVASDSNVTIKDFYNGMDFNGTYGVTIDGSLKVANAKNWGMRVTNHSSVTVNGTIEIESENVGIEIESSDPRVEFDENANVSVTGGNYAVYGTTAGIPTTTLNVGTYSGAIGTASTSADSTISITGGTYDSTTAGKYVAEDYVMLAVTADDGTTTYSAYSATDDAVSGNCVASIGGIQYKSLQSAIEDASTTDTTIVLLANIDTCVTVAAGQNITLDLNGYTLTSDGTKNATLTNYGTLTVVDNSTEKSGVITRVSTAKATDWYYVIVNEGKLTLDGVTVKNETDDYSSLIINNKDCIQDGAAQLTIKSGTYTSGGSNAVKNDEYGVLVIEGGTFTANASSGAYAAVMTWGTATISGGTFAATNGNVALTVASYGGQTNKTTITDGTFEGAVYVKNYDNNAANTGYVELSVSNGNFNGGIVVKEDCELTEQDVIAVTGGSVTNAIISNDMLKVGYVAYYEKIATAAFDGTEATKIYICELSKLPANAVIVGGVSETPITGEIDENYIQIYDEDTKLYYIVEADEKTTAIAKLNDYRVYLLETYLYTENGESLIGYYYKTAYDEINGYEGGDESVYTKIVNAAKAAMDTVETKYIEEKALADAVAAAKAAVDTYAIEKGFTDWNDYGGIEAAATIDEANAAQRAVFAAIDAKLATTKAAAVAEVQAAAAATDDQAAQDAVVIPTATYLAINSAATIDEVNFYKENALAEIADIRAYRAEISGLTTNAEEILDAIATLSSDLLTDETGALAALQTALESAIEAAQSDINNKTSSGLSELQGSLETAIATAVSDLEAYLDGKIASLTDGIEKIVSALGIEAGTEEGEYVSNVIAEVRQQVSAIKELLESDNGLEAIAGILNNNIYGLESINANIAAVQNYLEDTINSAIDTLTNQTDSISSIVTAIRTTLGDVNSGLVKDVADANGAIEELAKAFSDFNGDYATLANAIKAVTDAIGTTESNLKTELAAIQTALGDKIDALSTSLSNLSSGFDTFKTAYADDIADIKTSLSELSASLGTLDTALSSDVASVVEEIGKLGTKLNEIAANIGAAVEVDEVKTDAIAEIDSWLEQYIQSLLATNTADADNTACAAVYTAAANTTTVGGSTYDNLVSAFGETNANLIVKYYEDAQNTIENATSVTEISQAIATFKTQVSMIETLSAQESESTNLTGIYVLLAVIAAALVSVIVILLLKKKSGAPAFKTEAEDDAKPTETVAAAFAAEETAVTADAAPQKPSEETKDDSVVSFEKGGKKTLDEAFFELSDEKKNYYNEVARYASAVSTVTKHYKSETREEWKVGSASLLRMKIRRGEVLCEFDIQNSDVKERIADSSVSVKQSQTIVKLKDGSAVEFVFKIIDLAAETIEQEKQEKKKAMLARRRAKREKKKLEAQKSVPSEEGTPQD